MAFCPQVLVEYGDSSGSDNDDDDGDAGSTLGGSSRSNAAERALDTGSNSSSIRRGQDGGAATQRSADSLTALVNSGHASLDLLRSIARPNSRRSFLLRRKRTSNAGTSRDEPQGSRLASADARPATSSFVARLTGRKPSRRSSHVELASRSAADAEAAAADDMSPDPPETVDLGLLPRDTLLQRGIRVSYAVAGPVSDDSDSDFDQPADCPRVPAALPRNSSFESPGASPDRCSSDNSNESIGLDINPGGDGANGGSSSNPWQGAPSSSGEGPDSSRTDISSVLAAARHAVNVLKRLSKPSIVQPSSTALGPYTSIDGAGSSSALRKGSLAQTLGRQPGAISAAEVFPAALSAPRQPPPALRKDRTALTIPDISTPVSPISRASSRTYAHTPDSFSFLSGMDTIAADAVAFQAASKSAAVDGARGLAAPPPPGADRNSTEFRPPPPPPPASYQVDPTTPAAPEVSAGPSSQRPLASSSTTAAEPSSRPGSSTNRSAFASLGSNTSSAGLAAAAPRPLSRNHAPPAALPQAIYQAPSKTEALRRNASKPQRPQVVARLASGKQALEGKKPAAMPAPQPIVQPAAKAAPGVARAVETPTPSATAAAPSTSKSSAQSKASSSGDVHAALDAAIAMLTQQLQEPQQRQDNDAAPRRDDGQQEPPPPPK